MAGQGCSLQTHLQEVQMPGPCVLPAWPSPPFLSALRACCIPRLALHAAAPVLTAHVEGFTPVAQGLDGHIVAE